MTSDNLINDLFEIVQLNTKEKLSYDDFEENMSEEEKCDFEKMISDYITV